MKQSSLLTIIIMIMVSLSLVGMALAADTSTQISASKAPPPANEGSRSGTPDTTPPKEYISPESYGAGFEDITSLPGWYMQNNSDPLGITGWFQGNTALFEAQAGPPSSYIGADYNNTGEIGTISNWLLTPELELDENATITFWTRTMTGSLYPDRLQVRLSTTGPSTYVGSGAGDVGDFTNLLLEINPTQVIGGYPEVWTQYSITLGGYTYGTSGRVAFRYYVENAGFAAINSFYIGIDTVEKIDAGLVYPLVMNAAQPPNTVTTQSMYVCNRANSPFMSWELSEESALRWKNILLIDALHPDTSTSVQRALNELGVAYNYYNGDNYLALDFAPYETVILAMSGGVIDEASILKLRTNVIDEGKRLIFLGGTSLDPFANGVNQYLVLHNINNHDWSIPVVPHFTLTDPTHRLARELPASYNFNNASAGYYQIRVTDPNIEVVAENGDGFASLFYKDSGFPLLKGSEPEAGGKFIWFINAVEDDFWLDPGDYGILKQVIKNAIGPVELATFSTLMDAIISPDDNLVEDTDKPVDPVSSGSPPLSPERFDTLLDIPTGITTASHANTIVSAESSASPEATLWDQPLSLVNQNGYVNQAFPDSPTYNSYLADDFIVPQIWTVQSIYLPGNGWNGFTSLFNATALTWQIYGDNAGFPAGNPEAGGSLWSQTLSPNDPKVTITEGTDGLPSNVRLDLQSPIYIPPGHYWFVFYPTMSFTDYGQYGRQAADTTNGNVAKFINPGNGFGYGAGWQDWGVLGVPQTDIAFRFEGMLGNDFLPWLNENPTTDQPIPGTCSIIAVTFNSTGLAIGNYAGVLHVSSNLTTQPIGHVYVNLTVGHTLYLPLIHKP